jgi:hypothetical protein
MRPYTMAPPRLPYRRVTLRTPGTAKGWTVHALVLLAHTGPRPEGMVVRHLNGDPADNRLANLAYGTYVENQADAVRHGTSQALIEAAKTACPQGHPYDSENTYVGRQYLTGRPKRACRACKRESDRRWRDEHREEYRAKARATYYRKKQRELR